MPRFYWQATYAGGEKVTSDATPYEQINRRLLRRFEIIDRKSGEAKISMPLESSDCLIWRKRVSQKSDNTQTSLQIVARERGVGSFRIEVLHEESGERQTHTRFNPQVVWLNEPQRLPFEI
jgi:hypothetical protein